MPKLIVMSPEGESTTVELDEGSASIGRLASNTIQIDDVACSRRHCQILRIKSGFEMTDMKSRNGTKVNGIQRNRHVLSDGDIIEIGAVRITYRERSGAEEEVVLEDYGGETEIATEGDCFLVWAGGKYKGKKVPLSADRTTLGRKDSNTIPLKDHMVSSYHCEVTKEAGGYVLRDLGSTNGCVLNGETVSESTLSHGARLRLGKTVFVFVDPAVADFEHAMASEEDVESDWGMMRAQVDMARVKRKRTWNLIVSLVVVVFFGGIIGFVTWKPEAVQKAIGIEDAPSISRVPGNLVPDESFEGDEPVAWRIADETSGSADVLPGPTKQGQRSLEVVGPADGWGMAIARCSETPTVSPRKTYEVSAWIRPESQKTLARIGVEWIGDGRSQGMSFAEFAPGPGWEKVSAIFAPPSSASACRVVAVVTGPGSARFDDVALVPVAISVTQNAAQVESGPYRVRMSENGVLSVEMEGDYQLWDGGIVAVMKDGSVATAAGNFSVDRVSSNDAGIKAVGTMRLPDGRGSFPARFGLLRETTGPKLAWEASNVPADVAQIGLSFSVSRPWLSAGASLASESGSRALGGETDEPAARKVILGGPGRRLSLGADAPVRLLMTNRGGVLRMAMLSPADTSGLSFKAITDFAEEKKEARNVLSRARAKRNGRDFGAAIVLYLRVVNEFPYEDAVRAIAEKEGEEIVRQGATRLAFSQKLFVRAKDFHDMDDLRLALHSSEQIYQEYKDHDFSTQAKELAQAIAAVLAEKGDAFLSTRVGSLMKQGDELVKNEQDRLAALFFRIVTEEYPDTKVAEIAKKSLEDIQKRLAENKGQ